jgi:hypothetical protein
MLLRKEYQTANLSKLIVIFLDRSNQYLREQPQLHQQLNERNRGPRKFPGATARLTPLPDDELEELLVYRCLQADETARFNQRINLLLLVAQNPGQLNRSSRAIAKKSLFPQPLGVSASNKFLRV